MTCKKYFNLIMKYLDNELTPYEEELLRLHLKDCDPCREEFYFYSSLSSDIAHLPELTVKNDFEERVMAVITSIDSDICEKNSNQHKLLKKFVFIISLLILSGLLTLFFRKPIFGSIMKNPSLYPLSAHLMSIDIYVTESINTLKSFVLEAVVLFNLLITRIFWILISAIAAVCALQAYIIKKARFSGDTYGIKHK